MSRVMAGSLRSRYLLIYIFVTLISISQAIGEEPLSQNQQNSNLKCRPSTAASIAKFLLVNYLAHCATVVSYPGDSTTTTIVGTVVAFLFPAYGSAQAWDSIIRHTRLRRTSELQRAARAGALCMVVRSTNWKLTKGETVDVVRANPPPSPRQDIEDQAIPLNNLSWRPEHERESLFKTPPATIDRASSPSTTSQHYGVKKLPLSAEPLPGPDDIDVENGIIHGMLSLPVGYQLRNVPSDAEVVSREIGNTESSVTTKIKVASNYNLSKSIIGIVQVLYAGYTLHKARGNQITRYGYAAFGLTVTQYLVMSILNLLAQALTATYPAVYMVRTPEMDEAERHGGVFDGVVGHLIEDPKYIETKHANEAYRVKVLEAEDQLSQYKSALLWNRSSTEAQAKTIQLSKKAGRADYWVYDCSPFKLTKSRKIRSRGCGYRLYFYDLIPVLLCTVSIGIIGAVSAGFSKGQSTLAQRAWTMSWLASSYVFAIIGRFPSIDAGVLGTAILVISVPVVGGFVVVIQMLKEYGDCISWEG